MVNGKWLLAAAQMFVLKRRLLNRRITIKINKAKYCIALINSQILNYQPINSVCLDKQ
jgi:hypothetical protein